MNMSQIRDSAIATARTRAVIERRNGGVRGVNGVLFDRMVDYKVKIAERAIRAAIAARTLELSIATNNKQQ